MLAKMFRLVLLSSLLAISLAASPKIRPFVPMLDGRIVGGKNTDIESNPHHVSLQSSGWHVCGGSVLSPNRVLTAAHCTNGATVSRLSVRAGTSTRGKGGQVVAVAEIRQHKDFNIKTDDHDVSVLILARDLKMGPAIKPIGIQNKNVEIADGTRATVTGWGNTSSRSSLLPIQLQIVQVPKISDTVCKQKYRNSRITSRMHCFGYSEGGRDACQGDSGGPLVLNGKQVGIVSWGISCADGRYPGVYTKLSHPTIHDHIIRNS